MGTGLGRVQVGKGRKGGTSLIASTIQIKFKKMNRKETENLFIIFNLKYSCFFNVYSGGF